MNKYQQPGDIWRTSRTISGGVLYDWGVHLLEYSLQLMGEDAIREVSAFAHNGFWAPKTCWGEDTNEDEATAVVRFASGRFVALSISEIDSADIWRGLEITGTRGTYYMSPGQGEWKMIVQKKTGPKTTEGKDPVSEGWRFYQNIAEHLVKGEKLVITPQWARRPIHILDLATRSVRNNRAVRAKYE
jgi:predicted dehydrogenase